MEKTFKAAVKNLNVSKQSFNIRLFSSVRSGPLIINFSKAEFEAYSVRTHT